MKKNLFICLITCVFFIGDVVPCFANETQVSFLKSAVINTPIENSNETANAPTENSNDSFDFELSSFSTKFSASKENENRNSNIKLASNSINGFILKPNEIFSYNEVILNRSNQGKDYKEAGILIDAKSSIGVGGGICQVSSTLFEAALYSSISIVERYNHSAKVSYISPGRDATVSWGGADLKFKNTLPVDIKIESTIQDGILSIRFLTQEDPHIKKLVAFSRRQPLDSKNNLRGFYKYVQSLDADEYKDTPNYIIFGEWAIPHTVKYRNDIMNKWYIFDIYDVKNGYYLY